jgi:molybdopterin-synthase adenylyltransferase
VRKGIQEIGAYRKALDCDVLFSCVDRPWARSILNFIAYAHLIPVIDGGIRVDRKNNGDLRSAEWGTHVVGYRRQCLECIGQFSSGDVATEMDGLLDDPEYIESLPEESEFIRKENVFVFSMALASSELLKFVQLIGKPANIPAPNIERNLFPIGRRNQIDTANCSEYCSFKDFVAKGEKAGHPNTTSWP